MAPGLCESCHKKPKFGTHRFCGKTCAAQGATIPTRPPQSYPQTRGAPRHAGQQRGAPIPQKAVQLCIRCGQKPKFNGFDYCGKSCAAAASAAPTKPPTNQGLSTTKQKAARAPNGPLNNTQAPAPAKHHKASPTKVPAPQDGSSEDLEPDDDDDGGLSTDLDAYPSDSESESEDEPSVPAATLSQPSAKSATRGNKPGGGVPKNPPGICAIPGCGQPSHVDRKGVKTMYCSVKHREEAVKLGLEPACIMCQRYPQSTTDYFCSSACRNQSMTKT